jgi:20S proteasome subunit alpha 5
MEIDTHLGCAMSGLTADARTMIDHARVTAQNHSFTYDERIKVESATQAVCDLALRFGESMENEDAMMVRPSGEGIYSYSTLFPEESTFWSGTPDCWC